MGKRSNFERRELDFYPTPWEAIAPMVRYFPYPPTNYCEPCAGAGDLIQHLSKLGHKCVSAFDIQPKADGIWQHDASFLDISDLAGADMIITNPPWERTILHQIIERCAILKPTWLLFDADWMHTKQSIPYMQYCHKVVSIGRVKWIEGSAGAGKDNACWYLFDATTPCYGTIFHGRQ
jgi:hypothetical protein